MDGHLWTTDGLARTLPAFHSPPYLHFRARTTHLTHFHCDAAAAIVFRRRCWRWVPSLRNVLYRTSHRSTPPTAYLQLPLPLRHRGNAAWLPDIPVGFAACHYSAVARTVNSIPSVWCGDMPHTRQRNARCLAVLYALAAHPLPPLPHSLALPYLPDAACLCGGSLTARHDIYRAAVPRCAPPFCAAAATCRAAALPRCPSARRTAHKTHPQPTALPCRCCSTHLVSCTNSIK